MPFIKFKAYGRGEAKYINTDRVISFSAINSNGNPGTEFIMDDGSFICVGEWPEDIAAKISAEKEN